MLQSNSLTYEPRARTAWSATWSRAYMHMRATPGRGPWGTLWSREGWLRLSTTFLWYLPSIWPLWWSMPTTAGGRISDFLWFLRYLHFQHQFGPNNGSFRQIYVYTVPRCFRVERVPPLPAIVKRLPRELIVLRVCICAQHPGNIGGARRNEYVKSF